MSGRPAYDAGPEAPDPLVAVPERAPEAVGDLPGEVLVDALAALAAAEGSLDVASAPLPLLLALPGVRACAVLGRDGDHAVVLAAAGYDCGSMAPGSALPLDAGLPVTEALRTGRRVAQGTGPAWLAVPFGERRREWALLLSLSAAAPSPPDDLERLHRLARALGDALRRASTGERRLTDLALATAGLSLPASTPSEDVVVRSRPHDGPVGGDVALCLPDGRGGTWVVAADVCGCGLAAAAAARTVDTVVRAVAPLVTDPVAMLAAVERAVRPEIGPGSFVTVLAGRLLGPLLQVATAGHPAPVLVAQGRASVLDVPAVPPLALETGPVDGTVSVELRLPPDAVLLLHTDGLTDRVTPQGVRSLEPVVLLQDVDVRVDGPGRAALEALADRVLAAAEAVGPATDDVTLMVVRPRP